MDWRQRLGCRRPDSMILWLAVAGPAAVPLRRKECGMRCRMHHDARWCLALGGCILARWSFRWPAGTHVRCGLWPTDIAFQVEETQIRPIPMRNSSSCTTSVCENHPVGHLMVVMQQAVLAVTRMSPLPAVLLDGVAAHLRPSPVRCGQHPRLARRGPCPRHHGACARPPSPTAPPPLESMHARTNACPLKPSAAFSPSSPSAVDKALLPHASIGTITRPQHLRRWAHVECTAGGAPHLPPRSRFLTCFTLPVEQA